jgi:hypothetical protein
MTMLNSMKLWAIQSLVTALMTQLDAKAIRAFVDAGLELVLIQGNLKQLLLLA